MSLSATLLISISEFSCRRYRPCRTSKISVIRVSQCTVLRQQYLPFPRLLQEEGLGKGQQVVTRSLLQQMRRLWAQIVDHRPRSSISIVAAYIISPRGQHHSTVRSFKFQLVNQLRPIGQLPANTGQLPSNFRSIPCQ